ncbi:MAG: hypothetical protein LBT78_10725 [Tannerella sp.]|jgi:hypothetical protein|nr:hypothetical protein [Tannerella sp.]
MEKKSVKVVIPIYKTGLSELEMRSLQQACKVLKPYPKVIVKPESLDLSSLEAAFPALTCQPFDDGYFKGIAGYNRLMLSPDFYAAFRDTEYILIYQPDAYVFRDELTEWCAKGYDYIGAPWLKRPVYNKPLVSELMSFFRWLDRLRGKANKQSLYNKIGNGGLSLRKVESHYQAARQFGSRIESFLDRKHHLFNEDVFWATVPDFRYPEVSEALDFAFDKYPGYCYRLKNNTLPFGCHGWYKRKMKRFWQPVIGF